MAARLLSKFAKFREQEEFIDVRLKVGKNVFPAHRNVLAANSDYFYAMFTGGMRESNQEVIELKDENISGDALKIILDSIYSGELTEKKKVFEILAVANQLQVTSVVQQCCDVLDTEFLQRELDVQTYVRLSTFAEMHDLKNLQEATQRKMASMYRDICDSADFLSYVNADQLSSLLSRDDLSAPSETFVFKSVMQWINSKKEERMAVAAKVIGAVRLGLVDIKDVIDELNTEEMQGVPEIQVILSQAVLHNHMPSHTSKFALEKAKPRSTSTVLVAVCPQSHMQCFDVACKDWKTLKSLAPAAEAVECHYAESVGSKLYVAGKVSDGYCIYCYDSERNVWEKVPHSCGIIEQLCTVGDHMYAVSSNWSEIPQRYNFAEQQWQSIARIGLTGSSNLNVSGAAAFNSKLFVLYGKRLDFDSIWSGSGSSAVLYCFDPNRNVWEEKASTCQPHSQSSLFVVNSQLYVAGGFQNAHDMFRIQCASVEVYDEENNKWSEIDQKHIPSNNLGAVEIEGKVYFIINNFPIDSGIRIPPGELYPVCLDKWKALSNIDESAVLCYAPLKRETLKAN